MPFNVELVGEGSAACVHVQTQTVVPREGSAACVHVQTQTVVPGEGCWQWNSIDTLPRLRLPSGCIPCPTWEFQETEARRFWRRGGCCCSSWLGDMSGKAEIANSRLTFYGWGIPG